MISRGIWINFLCCLFVDGWCEEVVAGDDVFHEHKIQSKTRNCNFLLIFYFNLNMFYSILMLFLYYDFPDDFLVFFFLNNFQFSFPVSGKSQNVTHDTTNTHNFQYTVKKISQQKHTIFLLWFLFQFQMMMIVMIVMMLMSMTMSLVVSGCLYLQIDQLVGGGCCSDAMNERKKIPTISLMLLECSRQMKICNFKCTKPFCSPFALVGVHLSRREYDESETTNNN